MYKQQIELAWVNRPARRQVDESTIKREEARSSAGTNIWSGRSLHGPDVPRGGGGRDKKERSKYRCRPEVDVGRTRGSDAKQATFCLYFAKGCCSQGSACIYLHRLPTEEDEQYHKKDMATDIFGKEKRAEAEGYRKGAGTFERDNRTLYCNYEGAGSYDLPKARQLLEDNFNIWGPVKRIYIVHNKTLAFVEYEWRSSAEFAKEAMHKQGLLASSQKEVLTLRWASEDPNPTAVVATKRAHMDAFEQAAMSSWDALPEEQKQARILQLQMAHAVKKGRVISDYPSTDSQYGNYPSTDGQYPDTDAQYSGYDEGSAAENMTPEQYAEWYAQYYAYYYPTEGQGQQQAGGEGSHPGSSQAAEPGQGAEKEKGGNALALLSGYGSDSEDEDETEKEADKEAGSNKDGAG